MEVIGIDIGGVIITSACNCTSDTSFRSDNFLKTPEIPNAIDTIAWIVNKYSSDNVYIVTTCYDEIFQKSLLWLKNKDFYSRTGVKEENIIRVDRRQDKAPVCENKHITHFIDDKRSVLKTMKSVPNKILFNNTGVYDNKNPSGMVKANSWENVKELLE